jgi:hypothetical protein
MTTIAQMDCCMMLGIDPKTLRHWLRHANMQFAAHPRDARLKCLTEAQVQQLATLHGRPLPLTATVRPALPDVPPALLPLEQQVHPQLASEAKPLPTAHCGPVSVSEAADLMKRLAGLESSVTTMQEHLTYLALELLRERQRSSEQRLTALESLVQQMMGPCPALPALQQTQEGDPPDANPSPGRHLLPAELRARSRVIPLIEYGASMCSSVRIREPSRSLQSRRSGLTGWPRSPPSASLGHTGALPPAATPSEGSGLAAGRPVATSMVAATSTTWAPPIT